MVFHLRVASIKDFQSIYGGQKVYLQLLEPVKLAPFFGLSGLGSHAIYFFKSFHIILIDIPLMWWILASCEDKLHNFCTLQVSIFRDDENIKVCFSYCFIKNENCWGYFVLLRVSLFRIQPKWRWRHSPTTYYTTKASSYECKVDIEVRKWEEQCRTLSYQSPIFTAAARWADVVIILKFDIFVCMC